MLCIENSTNSLPPRMSACETSISTCVCTRMHMELTHFYLGIALDLPLSSTTTSQCSESSSSDISCAVTSTDHTVTKSTPDTASPLTPQRVMEMTPHSSVVDSNSEEGSDMESSNMLPPSSQTGVRYSAKCVFHGLTINS